MPTYGLGGDNPVYPPASHPSGGEICFPLPDGERILQDLESLPPCRDAVVAAEDALTSCESRAGIIDQRVAEQDRELADARKLVEDTRKAGQDAAKIAAGPWYQRVLNAGKWVALGIIVGFIGAAAK
ncbi:MAG: hypothetical protein WCV62_05995 [Candidatus Peribacteraceae bacterium]